MYKYKVVQWYKRDIRQHTRDIKGASGGRAGKNEKGERKENIIALLFGFMGYGMGWRGGLYKSIKWSL